MLLGLLSFLLAINATCRCNYWSRDGTPYVEMLSADNPTNIGLFSYESYVSDVPGVSCLPYSKDQLQVFWDKPFRVAYFLAILADLCIGISMVVLFLLSCYTFGKGLRRCIGFVSLLGSFAMALTFCSYASFITSPPYNARMSMGSFLAIGACLTSFLAGIFICLAPKAEQSYRYGRRPDPKLGPSTVTKTETIMPDGTKATTTTTVNRDGSQTVTETMEHTA